MIFSSVTPASRQTCRSCCGHCVQKIAGHRRSGAQRFWVGDDVIRCLVYRSALMNNFCGVTLSETRTVLQSSSSSSVTMKLVISDDFPFLQQGTGHEEIAQNSVSLESELSIFPPAAPCPFPSCLQPSRLYGSRPPRRSQPTARWTHSDLATAQRIPAGTRPDVLQLQPIWRCREHALMPAFWLDMSHMAANHFLSGRWVPSIIVPAVTESWREHLVHCHLCAWPCTLEQDALPQAGQTKPPGCFSSRSLLSHSFLLSPPLHGPSPLLPPLFRMHHHLILIVRFGTDRNCWGYAGGPKPFSVKASG
jgi:hypothetical protein